VERYVRVLPEKYECFDALGLPVDALDYQAELYDYSLYMLTFCMIDLACFTGQVDPLLLNALWKPTCRPDTASIGSFGSSVSLATTDKNARGWLHYFVLGCSRQAPPTETFNWLKELLFQHPELVMSRDANSRTPLHYLAMFEVRPSSSYLFEQMFKKMDPLSMFQRLFALARVRDLIGRSALHYAAERGDLELIKCLVEHCPQVEVDKFGDSPLMLAVRNAKFDVCQVLFRADASNHKTLPDAVSSLLQRIGIGNFIHSLESGGARTAADVIENDIWTNFQSLSLAVERGGSSVDQLICLSSEVADKVALMWGKNVFTAFSASLDVSCTVIHELCNRDSDIAIWRALFETLPLASWAILFSRTDSLGLTPIQYLMKRSISGSTFASTLLQYVITPLMLRLFHDCKLEQTFQTISQQQSTSAPSVAMSWALDDEYCFEYHPLDLLSDGAAASQVAADAIQVTIQHVVEILPSGPQVIDRATLARMREADIDAVAEVLSASALHLPLNARACAHSLLQSKRWDAERLLLQFSDDPSTVLTEAGLSVQSDVNVHELHSCQICFESIAISECLTACGHHWFDRTCWKGHLKAKLDNGVQAAFARCPAVQCRAFVSPDIWSAVMEDDLVSLNLYRKYSVDSYASFHKSSMRWCPHPDCDRAFVSSGTQQSTGIKCVCGTELCGICFNAAHAPSSCTQLAQWDDEKLARASDDLKAIMRECRACPKCRVVIYRNEGCNHMTCAQCSHEFCWKCKGPWADHGTNTGGFYECVLFDPIKHAEVNVLSRSGGADASTMRFVQFLHRVDLHAECETVARAQLSAGAVESVTRPALLELICSRMFLKNASIVLYFADQAHDFNQSLFALLMQLESHVELLTESVEKHAERRVHESTRRMMELCEARRHEFLQALSTFGQSN
jgi:ariadne-1